MWYLECRKKDGKSYRLTKDKDEHYVSRTSGDIVLSGDQSVSRKHAVFSFATDNSDNVLVTITDLGSKYGTYINGPIKMEPKKPYRLQDGDVITFGCQWNEWSFHSKLLVVTTSSMTTDAKANLKAIITEFGGTVVNDWQESCSHLTMAEILLTAKVVSALASGIPIVTPDYWTAFKRAIDEHELPPDYEQFVPPLKEAVLNRNSVSFTVDKKRQSIFSGKMFVFCSEKQLKKYKAIVVAAGGNCQTLAACEMTKEEFCRPNVILMQHSTASASQPPDLYNSVLRIMRDRGLKPIPESEIGLAVLMCSMDMHCNSRYNVVGNILAGDKVMSESQVKRTEVLAEDSQVSVTEPVSIKTERISVESKNNAEETFTPVLSIPGRDSLSCRLAESSTSGIVKDQERLPCDMVEAQRKNGTSASKLTSFNAESSTSRKRAASKECEEPSGKKGKPKTMDEELDEQYAHLLEPYVFTDILANDPQAPSKTPVNNGSGGSNLVRNVNTDFPSGSMSKRKLDEVDGEFQTVGSTKKPCSEKSKPSQFERVDVYPSTSRGRTSLTYEMEEDDQWMEDSEKSVKALVSTKRKGRSKKCEGGFNDFGIGMTVKMADLVVQDKVTPQESEAPDSAVVNFKKFRKAQPIGIGASLPQIIGESDLEVYNGGNIR